MSIYYQDWYGDQDASKDKQLFECFTQIDAHMDALHEKVYIVRAFKGSGKTAFLEQLKYCSNENCENKELCPFDEKFCDELGEYFVIPIDVTAISFQTLYNFTNSNSDPRFELTDMLTTIFKLIVINSVVDKFTSQYADDGNFNKITTAYKKEMIKSNSKRVLVGLFSALERGLTQSNEFVTALNEMFFQNSNIDNVYAHCELFLKDKGITALIVLDKFDTIIDLFKTSEKEKYFYHQTIATSLLLIGYDEQLVDKENGFIDLSKHNQVALKMLFPEDLYNTLTPRDKQKYDKHSIKIKWTFESLKSFLDKRLKILLPERITKNDQGFSISSSIFSKNIQNTYYDVSEKSLEYIVRHTLFKPRDIQEICVAITKEFVESKKIRSKDVFFKSLPIDPNYVKEGVKRGTQKIIEYLIIEFQAFNLKKILGLLRNKDNVMTYNSLYTILSKDESVISFMSPKEIISLLWDIGIIGVLREGHHEIMESYRQYKIFKDTKGINYVSLFSFSWTNGTEFQHDEQIVIAPMFNDYLDLKLNRDRIVYTF